MCVLEKQGLCRLSHHVWPHLQCWSLWVCCQYASCHQWGCWLWHYFKVGRQFPCNLSSQADLDGGQIHNLNWLILVTIEHSKDLSIQHHPEIHQFQLESRAAVCVITNGEAICHQSATRILAHTTGQVLCLLIGLQVALKYSLIDQLNGANYLVCSDNIRIVTVTNKGWSQSHKTNIILKHLYLLQAQLGIHLKTVYVCPIC